MSAETEPPALETLQDRLEEEEEAYSRVLASLDRLASFELPAEAAPEVRERLESLNGLWAAPARPAGGGLGGALRQRAWDAVAPALHRQSEFNAALVQLLNAHLGPVERLHGHLRELASALVQYAQRVQPLVDARGRVGTALATTRSELVLEAFDRRLESLGRRLQDVRALRERLEVSLAAPEGPRGRSAPGPRGLGEHVRRLRDQSPVVDLGCGHGALLEALGTAGIAARGVETDAAGVRACREKGLDAVQGDPVAFLREQPDGSLGAVVGLRIVEHLPPAALAALLAESHRTLRPTGLLVLEAANPGSVVGLLEGLRRGLATGRPLHPDTLHVLAAAAGFTDIRVETGDPAEPDVRLRPVPGDDLPEGAARALNENVDRLNALVYGPTEYALTARR